MTFGQARQTAGDGVKALGDGDPARIGAYRLLGVLGEGGMGRVYMGRSEGGRTVALKVVRSEIAQVPDFRRRFAREVDAARRVAGPWTAAVLDADVEAAVPWVATQYIPGPDLHTVVAQDFAPLPERSVRFLACRLALALQAVHGGGVIHRDLKPSNILVTVDGPRVIDFGIARALDALDATAAESAMTRTGVVIGSPGFMSPEQARGRELTPASDVFCLGSVLVYAATGRQPFGAGGNGGLAAQLFSVAEDEPDLSGVPSSLVDLVRDCLAKDPRQRPTPGQIAERTEDGSTEPWLPGEVLAQLGRRTAELPDRKLQLQTATIDPGNVLLTSKVAVFLKAGKPGEATWCYCQGGVFSISGEKKDFLFTTNLEPGSPRDHSADSADSADTACPASLPAQMYSTGIDEKHLEMITMGSEGVAAVGSGGLQRATP
ncbi:serine/threonine-protein kinase [Streptomyces sp. KN37]|uniref:serine/threonine-protein kinase n=1 Tax=Streptomyces sp. KN37 TaxID=3090667 RepID=UPI0039BEA961